MLKYIPGCIVMVVILAGFAYVSPTYAASANVVITEIQAGGVGASLEELVVIYNNSDQDVNISDWCLKNKSDLTFLCFKHDVGKSIYLPAYRYATIGSYPLAMTLNFYDFSYLYVPFNQNSGNITGGSDIISLVDGNNVKIDSHQWVTSLIGGMVLMRDLAPDSPLVYIDTDSASDWRVSSPAFIPESSIEIRDADPDSCPNLEGYQPTVPEGLEVGSNGDCREKLPLLRLWEILPNAAGSDTGKEFIELYNPNDQTVELSRYELLVGQNLEKTYTFPAGSSIPPTSYLSFSNAELGFSLLNTSSRVQLRGDREVLDESLSYQDPEEDIAWAIIDGIWQYTSTPTPGSKNLSSDESLILTEDSNKEEAITGLKPCNENQYRSTETHRCRLIETAASTKTPTPCKDNQYRSEETNRCRNIIAAGTGPAPCKEGQERNPDTNRCRNIKAMPVADYSVFGATTSSATNWYMWAAIGGILLLALAYTVWEWRYELGTFFTKLVSFVRIRK